MKGINFNEVVTEPRGVPLPTIRKRKPFHGTWLMDVDATTYLPSELEPQQSKELVHFSEGPHGRKFR